MQNDENIHNFKTIEINKTNIKNSYDTSNFRDKFYSILTQSSRFNNESRIDEKKSINTTQFTSINFNHQLNLNITDFAKYIKNYDLKNFKKKNLLEKYIKKKYNRKLDMYNIESFKLPENTNKIQYDEFIKYNENILEKFENANFKNTNEKPSKIILEILDLDEKKFKNTIKFIEIFIDSYINTVHFNEKSDYKKEFYDILYLIWYNISVDFCKNNNDLLKLLSIWFGGVYNHSFLYKKDILNEINKDKKYTISFSPFYLFRDNIEINYEMNSKFLEFFNIITSEETYNLFLKLKDEVYENYNYNIIF